MRFKVTGDHRKVLEKQRYIEFEDVFSTDELEKVSQHIDVVLGQRTRRLIETASCEELFRAGRDLWRDDSILKNFVSNRGVAQLAAELFQQKTLCLAFDQSLRTTLRAGFSGATPATVQKKSCIQPLAGAVLVQLSGQSHSASILPKKRENAVFIAPQLTLPWEIFFQEPQSSFLLIGYASQKALYVCEKSDPNLHFLKKLGYVFGDHLNTDHHPLLYK